MQLVLKHTFKCDEETFWTKIFFDEDYNRRLFGPEGLDFAKYEPLEMKDEGNGSKVRRMRTLPKGGMPAPLQKILGEPVSIEEGRYDGATKKWTFKIIPHTMADKISIKGEFRTSPTATGFERTTVIDINVDINFMINGTFEKFVEKTMRENYDKGAVFTNRYVDEKGLAKK